MNQKPSITQTYLSKLYEMADHRGKSKSANPQDLIAVLQAIADTESLERARQQKENQR